MNNRYVLFLGIVLLFASIVNAASANICLGKEATILEGYKVQLLSYSPIKEKSTATISVSNFSTPLTLAVDGKTTNEFTDYANTKDTSDDKKVYITLDYTTDHSCVYIRLEAKGGKTVEPTPVTTYSCSDSDGGAAVAIKGTTTQTTYVNGKESAKDSPTDYCASDSVLVEYFCSDNKAGLGKYTCSDGHQCSDGACVKKEEKPVCTSTDDENGAYNIYKKGTRTVDGTTAVEYCAENGQLVETWCKGNEGVTTMVVCPTNYQCSDGACVKATTSTATCTDTDGGKNVYKKGKLEGYIDGKKTSAEDGCSSTTQVVEYYCDGSEIKSTNADGEFCPTNYQCSDGACVKSTTEAEETKTAKLVVEVQDVSGNPVFNLANVYLYYADEADNQADIGQSTGSDGTTTFIVDIGRPFYIDGYNVQTYVKYGSSQTKIINKLNKLGTDVDMCDYPNDKDSKVCTKELQVKLKQGTGTVQAPTVNTSTDTTTTEQTNALTVYVYDSEYKAVSGAYVKMLKASDDSFIRAFTSDKNGLAFFNSWHFPENEEQVYFVATKDDETFEGSNGKLVTFNYETDEKGFCIYKNNTKSICGERFSTGLFEQTTVPPSPPTETEYGDSYAISLQPGWNLISMPFEYGKLVSTDCDNKNMYKFNTDSKSYNKKNLEGQSWFGFDGYWIKETAACTLKFNVHSKSSYGFYVAGELEGMQRGNFEQTLKLSSGWNLIGAPYKGALFSDIAGTCKLSSGPWWYSPEIKSWEKATTLQDGKGYFVKTTEECVLGSSMPPLPPS